MEKILKNNFAFLLTISFIECCLYIWPPFLLNPFQQLKLPCMISFPEMINKDSIIYKCDVWDCTLFQRDMKVTLCFSITDLPTQTANNDDVLPPSLEKYSWR